MEDTKITLKIKLGEEIRRICSKEKRLDLLEKQIEQLFGLNSGSFALKYKDEEGDLVTISTEEELLESFRTIHNNLLKLEIVITPKDCEGKREEKYGELMKIEPNIQNNTDEFSIPPPGSREDPRHDYNNHKGKHTPFHFHHGHPHQPFHHKEHLHPFHQSHPPPFHFHHPSHNTQSPPFHHKEHLHPPFHEHPHPPPPPPFHHHGKHHHKGHSHPPPPFHSNNVPQPPPFHQVPPFHGKHPHPQPFLFHFGQHPHPIHYGRHPHQSHAHPPFEHPHPPSHPYPHPHPPFHHRGHPHSHHGKHHHHRKHPHPHHCKNKEGRKGKRKEELFLAKLLKKGLCEIEQNYVCGGCDKKIRGDRFHCLECLNFDLCSSCLEKKISEHPQHKFETITALEALQYALRNGKQIFSFYEPKPPIVQEKEEGGEEQQHHQEQIPEETYVQPSQQKEGDLLEFATPQQQDSCFNNQSNQTEQKFIDDDDLCTNSESKEAVHPFQERLDDLDMMGFSDRKKNILALVKNKGDIQLAIEYLLHN